VVRRKVERNCYLVGEVFQVLHLLGVTDLDAVLPSRAPHKSCPINQQCPRGQYYETARGNGVTNSQFMCESIEVAVNRTTGTWRDCLRGANVR
jgi:hypothetical protein